MNSRIAPTMEQRMAARQPDGKRRPVMYHRWESLLFLHWRVSPQRVQATLPDGLFVDLFEGEAYLGIVPFFMRNVRPVGMPALPWLSDFLELNVRTYVHDRHGIPGIWFYSLDCNQPLAVAGARAFTGLPYFQAEMRASGQQCIDYSSRRMGTDKTAKYRFRRIGQAATAGQATLEFFLLERYYLFAVRLASLIRIQVSHQPYRYSEVQVEEFSCLPALLDGFAEIEGLPIQQCLAEALDVQVYATQKVE